MLIVVGVNQKAAVRPKMEKVRQEVSVVSSS